VSASSDLTSDDGGGGVSQKYAMRIRGEGGVKNGLFLRTYLLHRP
jgi:hypothetical protein